MNRIIYLLFLISVFSFSQNEEATLHFRDGGESIKGLGNINKNGVIEFRLDKKGEVSKWTGDVVKGITFHDFERDIDFEFVLTKKFKRHPKLMKVLVFGEVNLYSESYSYSFVTPFESGIGSKLAIRNDSASKFYYVQKASEPFAIRLKGNFKKRIKEYFGNDCIGIQKRIKNHEFRWTTLPELVTYYNNYCVDF